MLSAEFVPVNDLGTQTYEYYAPVGGMVSRISCPTLLMRLGSEKKDCPSLLYKSPDSSIQSAVPLVVPNFGPLMESAFD